MRTETGSPDGWEDRQWVRYNDYMTAAVVWATLGLLMFFTGQMWATSGIQMPGTDLAEMTIGLGTIMAGTVWSFGGVCLIIGAHSFYRLSGFERSDSA